MSDIVLSAGVRSNLLQLQQTSDLITRTQVRLSTGKLIVVGTLGDDAFMARFNADGSLDGSFGGGDGFGTIDLPGLAALAKGLRVTFSDCDATALRFAAENARMNGFEDFRLLQLDWHDPPTDLQVPIVLASDLVYELRNVEPLVGLIKKVLRPDGVCLMTDQDRAPSYALRETLAREGLTFTTHLIRAGEPGGRRVKGSLYQVRHGS